MTRQPADRATTDQPNNNTTTNTNTKTDILRRRARHCWRASSCIPAPPSGGSGSRRKPTCEHASTRSGQRAPPGQRAPRDVESACGNSTALGMHTFGMCVTCSSLRPRYSAVHAHVWRKKKRSGEGEFRIHTTDDAANQPTYQLTNHCPQAHPVQAPPSGEPKQNHLKNLSRHNFRKTRRA